MKDVLKIADGVLKECMDKDVETVVIPEGVTEIGGCAFKGCESLASVEIPSSVTVISAGAFKDCTSLTSVAFSGTVAQWKSVEKGIRWNDGVPATSVKCSDGEAEL